MLATIAFVAFLASTTADAFPRLGVAKPEEAASAVASCMKAARPGAVDEARLTAAGWNEQADNWANGHVFTHRKSAAVIYTMDAPLGGACWVRVRLANAASIDAAAVEIDGLLGVKGQRRSGELGKFFWRTGNRIIASEGFDDGPGSPPYVIQIAIGEWPKEFR